MKKALVLSLICVLGFTFAGMAATLSGEWDTDVIIKPLGVWGVDALTLTSEITVDYTVGDWVFTSVSTLTEAGWADQVFSAAGVLGAFSLSSVLDLDPAGLFDSWKTTGAVSIAGVTFSSEFEIDGDDAMLTLGGTGVAGDVTIGVDVTFGELTNNDGCDLNWTGVTINVGFPFCCADMALVLEFDCTGFVSACFSTGGIAIPNIPWLTLDVDVCFTLDEKTVTLTPGFVFGDIACFDIDLSFASAGGVLGTPLTVGDIVISGIGLTCDIGAVTFEGYTDFTGTEDYFEWYKISTNDDGCCGPFAFDLGFYFLDGGVKLFDIALITANMELQIASQFLFNMGLEIDVEAGAFTLWTVGFVVTW